MAEQVALLNSIHGAAHQVFDDAGFEVVTFNKSVTQAELSSLTDTARAIGVRSGPKISDLAIGDNLEAVAVFGAGVSHVQGLKASEHGVNNYGIAVFNASHENTRSVAELVVGSSIALLRDFHTHDRSMQAGTYSKADGQELRGKTLGIIGYGTIGQQVSVMAETLAMDVIAYDPFNTSRHGRAEAAESVEEVLEKADIVTLHTPGGAENHHLINADSLRHMKKGSYLINAARAELVDYDALIEALDSGRLAGAVIDVYSDKDYTEPEKNQPFDHPLRGHDKVLCLPHIGGSTREAQANIGRAVAQKVVSYLATGTTVGSVNLPSMALDTPEAGTSRLLNIHENRPGALAHLTGLISGIGLNIKGSTLRTKGDIGYAAIEVEGVIPDEALVVIGDFSGHRRTRVIT